MKNITKKNGGKGNGGGGEKECDTHRAMIGAPQPTSRPQTREQKRGGWIQDLLLHKEKEREFVEASNCAHTLNRARVASDVVNIFFFF